MQNILKRIQKINMFFNNFLHKQTFSAYNLFCHKLLTRNTVKLFRFLGSLNSGINDPNDPCNSTEPDEQCALRKLYFHFLSTSMGYDLGDNFLFDFEPNGIPSGSKSKGKLSSRS